MQTATLAAACVVAAGVLSTGIFSATAAAQPLGFSEEHLLLESSGITKLLLDKFAAGKPLADDDRGSQITVLSALKHVSPYDLDRFAESPKDFKQAIETGRGELWRVRGKLKSVEAIDLTDEEVARLYPELDNELPPADLRRKIYRCELTLDDGGAPATVVALKMPAKLLAGVVGERADGERVGVHGLLVKNAATADAPHPVFFARRPAWYPLTYLGDLGMDYGLYDDVRDVTGDLKQEHEALYRLLSTMRKADQSRLFADATANYDPQTKSFSVVPLFNDPASMRGKLATLEGTARRAVAVLVSEPDVQERFGIKKYYEVAMYTLDSQQNPILFDLLELPPGFPEGENIHANVRIPGSFLTGFYYKRDATPDEQSRGIKPELQKAPLLIGKGLEHLPPPVQHESYVSWLFGLFVAGAFVVITIAVWRATRGERRTREILHGQTEQTPGTSLNDAKIEDHGPLDLSKFDPDAR